MKFVFATNNLHKLEEIRAVLPQGFEIIGLKEAGILIDIPEPHATLEANAREKAVTIFAITLQDCFSEDTGLEVFSLNGEPGVRSARYADNEPEFRDNTDKLLSKLKAHEDRKARFRTVICLLLHGEEHFFEGICNGKITGERKGEQGFGYDPVFIPDGAVKTFAEMNMEEKNQYSHRRKAVDKLLVFLNQIKHA